MGTALKRPASAVPMASSVFGYDARHLVPGIDDINDRNETDKKHKVSFLSASKSPFVPPRAKTMAGSLCENKTGQIFLEVPQKIDQRL